MISWPTSGKKAKTKSERRQKASVVLIFFSDESVHCHLVGRDRVVGVLACRAVMVSLRRVAALAEDAVHEGPGATALDVAEDGEVVVLGCLPALLDAVIDKSHEPSCNNDTETMLEFHSSFLAVCV